MNAHRTRPGMVIATVGAIVAVVCLTATPLAGGDPMLAVEATGAAVLSVWTVVGLRQVVRGRRLARALDGRSTPDAPTGVPCRIVRGGGRRAFVLGALRPKIYVGDALIATLDADELWAVLLHEEHHRRTRAPLRAVGLEAWLALFGRAAPIRNVLLDRLTDLEEDADADALRRGAEASALASALLKADPSFVLGASFVAASAQRLENLVALANGGERVDTPRLPYEWLPIAAIAIVAAACHLTGMSPLG